MKSNKEIDFQFNPVPIAQLSEGQKHRAMKLTKRMQELAEEIVDLVPCTDNRERILRHVLDIKFWCIQEITHDTGVLSAQEKVEKAQASQNIRGQAQGGPAQTQTGEGQGEGSKTPEDKA